MSEESVLAELDLRLDAFFIEQYQGGDIPPAELYRLEGMLETIVKLGLRSEQILREKLRERVKKYVDSALLELYQQDTRLILHMAMREAPVYPSRSPE